MRSEVSSMDESFALNRSATRPMSNIIIAQSDGDILRGGQSLTPEEKGLLSNAIALTALLASAGTDEPAWMDIEYAGARLLTVAFDQQFVFVTFAPLDGSRRGFIEEARQVFGG